MILVRLLRTFDLPANTDCPEWIFLCSFPQTSLSVQALLARVSFTWLGARKNLSSQLKASLCSRHACALRENATRGECPPHPAPIKKKKFQSKSRVVSRILDQKLEDMSLGLVSWVDHSPSLEQCPCLEIMGLDPSELLSAGQLTGFVISCTYQSALTLLPCLPPIHSPQGWSQLFRMNEFGRWGFVGW